VISRLFKHGVGVKQANGAEARLYKFKKVAARRDDGMMGKLQREMKRNQEKLRVTPKPKFPFAKYHQKRQDEQRTEGSLGSFDAANDIVHEAHGDTEDWEDRLQGSFATEQQH